MVDRMVVSSEPLVHHELLYFEKRLWKTDDSLTDRPSPIVRRSSKTATTPIIIGRLESLNRDFPRSSLRNSSLHRRPALFTTKLRHRMPTLSSLRHPKRRVEFHKIITSIFSHNSTRETPYTHSSRDCSGTSSMRSRAGSLLDSFPSLDIISPAQFLFSSPSLRSTRSDSRSNSASGLPSQMGIESHSLCRVHSTPFSADGVSPLDEVLEPLVECGIIHSLSDILFRVCTLDEGLAIEKLDKDDAVVSPQHEGPSSKASLDIFVFSLLLPHLDFPSWKALRLTCWSWHTALESVSPPKFPTSYHLPAELLQHVYDYLGPKDFNAARHTCWNWMWASLSKNLLLAMLRRGGWRGSTEAKLYKSNQTGPEAIRISEEWALSQLLSRECALSANWSGNGLDTIDQPNPLVEVSHTHFTDLANGYSGPLGRYIGALVFSVSTCGRLLLIARETLIFVYELQGAAPQFLTSITCPRRVLSMSMDFSSDRNAIATLLEGRMGMVCELQFGPDTAGATPVGSRTKTAAITSIFTSRASENDDDMNIASSSSINPKLGTPISGPAQEVTHNDNSYPLVGNGQEWTTFDSVDVQANYHSTTLQGTDDHRTYDRNWINQTWNINLRGAPARLNCMDVANHRGACAASLAIRTGTSTFYRHLCAEDDPPRSVAICPQRHCVAFGCSAGIELHWIDALAGQSLSRWFPLTTPSDYLFFLPPRPGFESAKKLRVISSAAHPNDRPAINRQFSSNRPAVSSFWGVSGSDNYRSLPVQSACDHFHAVPLSDGHHILFVDPCTEKLCVGCDAPLGGPNKLLRKIILDPPKNGQTPRLYTVAHDLTWGARIVAVYSNTVVLYSIPPDVIALSNFEQKAETWEIYTAWPFDTKTREKDHWLNWWDEHNYTHHSKYSPVWPITVRGTELGVVPGICELAILTRPDITVWVFRLDSQATAWQLRREATTANPSCNYICRSGMVHCYHYANKTKDVTMKEVDNPPLPSNNGSITATEGSVGFDGHSSSMPMRRIPNALSIENDGWIDLLDVKGGDSWYTMTGDVIMADSS